MFCGDEEITYMGKCGKNRPQRKPEYLKIVEIPGWVKHKFLSAWCLTSDAHLEMPENEVNTVMVLHHISRMGFTSSACKFAKLLQLCLTLCDSMDCSLPSSSVHGILQARTEYWSGLPCPPLGDLPHPGIKPVSHVSSISRWVLYH